MTFVHLVRHGEVNNPEGLLYGREPGFFLTEKGERQAHVTADFLAHRNVTHVRTSPLERARQTSLAILSSIPMERSITTEIDDRVIENGNLFSGMRLSPESSGLIRRPALIKRLWNPFNPSWGESYKEMAARVMAAVHDSRIAAGDGEAVIVSHQLPIWATRLFLEGRPGFHDPRKRHAGLCSITSLLFDGAQVVGISYNDPAAGVE